MLGLLENMVVRNIFGGRVRLKCDGTRAENRFRLSAKRTSPFKSTKASVQSTTGSRGVRISGSNAGYTMFRGTVKGTGYPLHSPVFPSLQPPVRHRAPSCFNWTLRENMWKEGEDCTVRSFTICTQVQALLGRSDQQRCCRLARGAWTGKWKG